MKRRGFLGFVAGLIGLGSTQTSSAVAVGEKTRSEIGENKPGVPRHVKHYHEVEDWNKPPSADGMSPSSREVETLTDNDEEMVLRVITRYRYADGRSGQQYGCLISIKKTI